MNHIIQYDANYPPGILDEILLLAKTCNIGEEYNSGCDIVYVWIRNDQIVAVIALTLTLFTDGQLLPRWEHVFYHPSVRRTRHAYSFILQVFQALTGKHKRVFCLVGKEKDQMKQYAMKFGFYSYKETPEGTYLIKELQPQPIQGEPKHVRQ